MSRRYDSKIVDRFDQHHRADARRNWESAVKMSDPQTALVTLSEPVDALAERFNTSERSINLLRSENNAQSAAFYHYRRRSLIHLIAAALIASLLGGSLTYLTNRLLASGHNVTTSPL